MSANRKPVGSSPIKIVDAKTAILELRREYAMRNLTWPCVLLKDLMPLCDAHDSMLAELTERRAKDALVAELVAELRSALVLARSYMSDAVEYDSPCAKRDAHTVDSAIDKALAALRGGAA